MYVCTLRGPPYIALQELMGCGAGRHQQGRRARPLLEWQGWRGPHTASLTPATQRAGARGEGTEPLRSGRSGSSTTYHGVRGCDLHSQDNNHLDYDEGEQVSRMRSRDRLLHYYYLEFIGYTTVAPFTIAPVCDTSLPLS